MARIVKDVIYLCYAEIVEINNKILLETQEGFLISKVANENSLQYLTEAVYMEFFGEEIYKTIEEKASVYAFNIIKDHVFYDGNKRTGVTSSLLFLLKNKFYISKKITQFDIIKFALNIATDELSFNEIVNWYERNIVEI